MPPASARPIVRPWPPPHTPAADSRADDPGPWDKRSGTSRYRPRARRLRSRWPKARPSAPGCQSAAAQAARSGGRAAAASRTSGRSIAPSEVHWAWPTSSASCRPASSIVARANHFALDVGQFLGESLGHRGRRRDSPRPDFRAPAAEQPAELCSKRTADTLQDCVATGRHDPATLTVDIGPGFAATSWRKSGPGTCGNSRPRVQAPSLPGCQGRNFASRTPIRTAGHRQLVAQRSAHEPGPSRPGQPLGPRVHRRRLVDGPMAQMDELVRDVDLHRADLAARPAQRRGERQLARLLQAQQVRREDRADGAGIDPAVGPAAHAAVDRAVVQARPAADAMQRRPGGPILEHVAPPVVQQNDVQLSARRGPVDQVRVGW